MSKSLKSLFHAVYITLGFFVGLFVVAHIVSIFYISNLSNKEIGMFNRGIQQDTKYDKDIGDQLAQSPEVINDLNTTNNSDLLNFTLNKAKQLSVGIVTVANKQGVVVSRTLDPASVGSSNAFLISPTGRVVATGKSVQSIELTNLENQLFITTARPVYAGNEMIGALFASNLMDDAYASHFKNTYLSNGAEVVFYTKGYGVYGSSFSDPTIKNLVKSYFNTGSDWISLGLTGKTVKFNNGKSYLVENIIFPGLEQSPGGALLFIPRNDISTSTTLIEAIIILLLFLFFALGYHFHTRGEERGWRYYTVLIAISICIFIISNVLINFENVGYLQLKNVPYVLYNSTLHLEPDWGIYNIGSPQSMAIVVETGDESINAVSVELHYDPKEVTVSNIDTTNSACSYFIDKSIDAAQGLIKVSCVLLNQPVGQKSLQIATVVTNPVAVGTFDLSFDQTGSQVLANDGLGTNVLRMSQDGSYRVANFDLSPADPTQSDKRSFVVFSPTHPNQAEWYNVPTAQFVWIGKPGATYNYAFDNSPTTIPDGSQTTQDTKIAMPIPGDGTYYFHLQLASGGPIAHYEIQSDRTPPVITALEMSEQTVYAGDVARFNFKATDLGSGMQKNYYIAFNNGLFLPVGPQAYVPFPEAGQQQITLRVYDNAGNYTEKTETIDVLNKPSSN